MIHHLKQLHKHNHFHKHPLIDAGIRGTLLSGFLLFLAFATKAIILAWSFFAWMWYHDQAQHSSAACDEKTATVCLEKNCAWISDPNEYAVCKESCYSCCLPNCEVPVCDDAAKDLCRQNNCNGLLGDAYVSCKEWCYNNSCNPWSCTTTIAKQCTEKCIANGGDEKSCTTNCFSSCNSTPLCNQDAGLKCYEVNNCASITDPILYAGCKNTCMCNANCSEYCVDLPVCGNKVLERNEQCDDGNLIIWDWCSSSCQKEWDCSDIQVEQCIKEACSWLAEPALSSCQKSCNADCSWGACTIQVANACYDDCKKQWYPYEVCKICYETCSINSCTDEEKSECFVNNCNGLDGDAYVSCKEWCNKDCNPGSCTISLAKQCIESCIAKDRDTTMCEKECLTTCNFPSTLCGDKLIQAPETCDDGNIVSGDGCSNSCILEQGWSCETLGTCTKLGWCTQWPTVNCNAICGDTLVVWWEQCDDGNLVSGDWCSANCSIESTMCGNWKIEAWEQCDDGNNIDWDGCNKVCTIEPWYECNIIKQCVSECSKKACTNVCTTLSVCNPICWDGIIIAPEQCDDGNLVSGDGCSAICSIETWTTTAWWTDGWSTTSTGTTVWWTDGWSTTSIGTTAWWTDGWSTSLWSTSHWWNSATSTQGSSSTTSSAWSTTQATTTSHHSPEMFLYLHDPYECGGDIHGQVQTAYISNITLTVSLMQKWLIKYHYTPTLNTQGWYKIPVQTNLVWRSDYVKEGNYSIEVKIKDIVTWVEQSFMYMASINNDCENKIFTTQNTDRDWSKEDLVISWTLIWWLTKNPKQLQPTWASYELILLIFVVFFLFSSQIGAYISCAGGVHHNFRKTTIERV